MSSSTRNFLLAAGALWGFVLALVPAVVMFAGPLNPTIPRLRAALRRPKRGNRNLGRRPVDESGAEPSQKRRLVAAAALRRPDRGFAGGRGRGAAVAGVLATLSIWLAMTITTTGFSTATPGAIYLLVSQPSIFRQKRYRRARRFYLRLARRRDAGPVYRPRRELGGAKSSGSTVNFAVCNRLLRFDPASKTLVDRAARFGAKGGP